MGEMMGHMQSYEGTHLFLVRLQADEREAGEIEWCGRVQRVTSGETYTFAGWQDLIEHLLTMLPDFTAVAKQSQASLPMPSNEE